MESRSYRLIKAGQRASRGLRTGSPLAENLNAARGHFHVPPTGFGSNASPVQSENSTALWGSQCPRGPHGFGRSPPGAPCSACIPPPAANLCLNLPKAPWGTTDPVRPYKPADAMSSLGDETEQSGFAQSLEVGKILLPAHRALVGDELRPTDEGDGDVAVSAGLPTRPAFLPGYSQE